MGLPQRSSVNHAHSYVAAPYGVYKTQNGYLALAMGNISFLSELLSCPALAAYPDPKAWFDQRDEIKKHLASGYWYHISLLEPYLVLRGA